MKLETRIKLKFPKFFTFALYIKGNYLLGFIMYKRDVKGKRDKNFQSSSLSSLKRNNSILRYTLHARI